MSRSVPPRTVTSFARSDAYRREIHDLIPGGAHTYSRGDDQFPLLAPAAIARGKGARVWDLDGNEYVDCTMALGSINLGYAYEPVVDAVRAQLELGSGFQRPASIEIEFAREFIAEIPGAERVKFAKNGSSVTSAAVKLARAFTGRELVAFPGNHPFYSYDDWFIGRTLCNSGVPEAVQALSVTYDSTRPETLERLFHEYPGRIACVITEAEEAIRIDPGVIKDVERLTRRAGALFIVDEMVTGYRAGWPGASAAQGLTPDLVTWGKAIGNGFSFCALTGRADVMDLGGIRQTAAPRVFLISSTHGGEAHAVAAARAVLHEYKTRDVIGRQGRTVADVAHSMRTVVAAHGLERAIEIHDSPWRVVTVPRDAEGRASLAFRTLLMQEMIGRGVLFQGAFIPCYSHTPEDVAQVVQAFDAACGVYGEALRHGIDKFLVGPAVRPVFRKYNGCLETCPATPCPREAECRSGG
jgi:glutamate-1-semialdehyde 2,1-aminomutase